jgi:methyl-accepting chemotaxis protein
MATPAYDFSPDRYLNRAASQVRTWSRNLHSLVVSRARAAGRDRELVEKISCIGMLGRDLVRASMKIASHANEQRQRVHDALDRQRNIVDAATGISASSLAVSQQTVAVAEEIVAGTATIEATNRKMSEMVATVSGASQMMQDFVARMAEVNKIVDEIGGIARQTNLLAINAAIEAAHAGREGDGFSVIAQEIRALADRARRSTVEIDEKISTMNASAKATATAMQAGSQAAAHSIAENAKVQTSLTGIRSTMQEIQRIAAEVVNAAQGQIAAGHAMSESVTHVDQMADLSSLESDAGAEISLRLVEVATAVLDEMRGVSPGTLAKRVAGKRLTDRIMRQVQEHEASIRAALSLLRGQCAAAGTPHLAEALDSAGGSLASLHFGGIPASDGDRWVDAVQQRMQCAATIFAVDGDRFVRVATSVKRLDGARATGSVLNPRGMAIRSLSQGEGYFGVVYVLGNPYVAAYEPLFSDTQRVVGAIYAGRPILWQEDAK